MAAKGIVAVTPAQFTTFGELLRFLRRRAGLTQRELAIAVGYSESQISRLEKNERAPEQAMLAARFVPALFLEKEHEWSRRLLELGRATHERASGVESSSAVHSTPNNLPFQLTSFIGRAEELTELNELLSGPARFISLTGPGGCGKTRLGLKVAGEQLDFFPDGVWFVELAPLADAALLPHTVAAILGMPSEPGQPVLSSLQEHLKNKRVLILLNNCEHMVQATAHLVETLFRVCPDIHVLATSREILGVAGERSYSVPSLSFPEPGARLDMDMLLEYEAIRLFVERGTVVRQDFVLTDKTADAVVRICQRLNGIPLALELAAARLRMMSVEQIAIRLDNSFRLLTGGTRTALPRHQTLQALIDWSYDLLPEQERLLFQRLAVFAGGWTLDAAEAVCADETLEAANVLELLSQLISKSLVQVVPDKSESSARYQMLETIRQYAFAKLEASGEQDVVRSKHVDYYLGFLESFPHWSRPSFEFYVQYDLVQIEVDNLRAAMAWTLSQREGAESSLRLASGPGWFWYVRSDWSEASDLLRKAISHPQASLYPEAQMNALIYLGNLVTLQGHFAEGEEYFSQSLRLAQKMGDLSSTARILERLGWLARERNDPRTAHARLEQSAQIFKDLGDQNQLGWTLLTQGEVTVLEEDTSRATSLLEEALQIMQVTKDQFGMGWALNHKGHVAQMEGEYARANELHLASLPCFREIGSQHGIAWAEHGLGESALDVGNVEVAKSHLMSALRLFHTLGDRGGISWCLAGLAGVAVLEEEPERAAFLWGAAEALRHSLGTRPAPASRVTRERLMATARKQLGGEAFNAAWEEGQRTSLEQAIASAIQD